MKTRMLCVVLCLVMVFCIPATSLAGGRATLPNAVDLELLGKCALYSFSYQRMVSETFGLEAGLSILGSGGSGDNSTIIFITGGAKVYLLKKDASPFLALGYVGVTNATDKGPFGSDNTSGYGYLGPGFEYRSEGGFLARASVYGLIANGGFFVWPGITIGIAF